jgi:hypothetical protein
MRASATDSTASRQYFPHVAYIACMPDLSRRPARSIENRSGENRATLREFRPVDFARTSGRSLEHALPGNAAHRTGAG